MKMTKWMRSRLVLSLVALALLAIACGDGADTSTSEESPDESAEEPADEPDEEPADEPAEESADAAGEGSGEPLRVMISEMYDVGMSGVHVADEFGIFEEMGLEVELLVGQDVAAGLASGDVDVGLSSPNRFIGAVQQGLEVTIVGPTEGIWSQYIIANPNLGVESVEDLEPGSIGISRVGSAGHYSGVKLAEELGWSEDEYEIVELGGSDGLMAALRQGQLDIFMWSGQVAFALEDAGEAVLLGNVGDFIGPNPINVIVASNEAIAERPADLRTFCEAFYEGQRTFKEDPELAVTTFTEDWGFEEESTPRIVQDAMAHVSTDAEITDEMLDNMAEATNFTIDGVDDLTGDDVPYIPCDEL
jgi:ABC-type nitrate/sulfonate/bicarbonate transport system substrate-binding protein